MVRKGMGGRSCRDLRRWGTHQPWEGSFPRILKAPYVMLCINHQEPPFPTLLSSIKGEQVKGNSLWREIWGPDHIGPQFRVPTLLLVPLGVSDLPDQDQASDTNELCSPWYYIWHFFQWLFTVVYLHDLITYSCTKCMEMLWGLFPLQIQFTHMLPPAVSCITTSQVLLSRNHFYNHT